MGLTNSPATFQRAMNMVLSGMNWVSCLVYLDDIIVFSKTEEEHLSILEQVFTRLRHFGFSLKMKKCNFFAKEAEYLGHAVSKEGRRRSSPSQSAGGEGLRLRCSQDDHKYPELCGVVQLLRIVHIPDHKIEPRRSRGS